MKNSRKLALKATLPWALASALLSLPSHANHNQGHVDVAVPELSKTAQMGQGFFNQTCAQCHGENGSGTQAGPPLIHKIYEPSHHGDPSFFNAMRKGVRSHHWSYGNMPAQPQVGFMQANAIVAFIREVQRHNGID
ncbi:MAG: c-type cytochrome [Pontibacterium sp.]